MNDLAVEINVRVPGDVFCARTEYTNTYSEVLCSEGMRHGGVKHYLAKMMESTYNNVMQHLKEKDLVE